MNIADFIKETIKQVSDGIFAASLECSQSNVIVNPTISVGENGEYYIPRTPSSVAMQRRVQTISFDIAVEASEAKEKDGQSGLSIHVVSGKVNYSKRKTNSTISRVSISIPVCPPTQDCLDE